MKTTSVAPVLVMREISRLLAIYARPKYWPTSDEEVARRWAEIFDGISDGQLARAVSLYLGGDHSFMPKPGQLRALAQRQPRVENPDDADSFQAWLSRGYMDVHGALAPCPACGRAWQAHPRVTLVHDHSQHRALGLSCIGTCDELACLGTYEVPPTCAPARVSPGELWSAPAGWSSTLRAIHERREAVTRARDIPPPELQPCT